MKLSKIFAILVIVQTYSFGLWATFTADDDVFNYTTQSCVEDEEFSQMNKFKVGDQIHVVMKNFTILAAPGTYTTTERTSQDGGVQQNIDSPTDVIYSGTPDPGKTLKENEEFQITLTNTRGERNVFFVKDRKYIFTVVEAQDGRKPVLVSNTNNQTRYVLDCGFAGLAELGERESCQPQFFTILKDTEVQLHRDGTRVPAFFGTSGATCTGQHGGFIEGELKIPGANSPSTI